MTHAHCDSAPSLPRREDLAEGDLVYFRWYDPDASVWRSAQVPHLLIDPGSLDGGIASVLMNGEIKQVPAVLLTRVSK